jgi:hypothetical protein
MAKWSDLKDCAHKKTTTMRLPFFTPFFWEVMLAFSIGISLGVYLAYEIMRLRGLM